MRAHIYFAAFVIVAVASSATLTNCSSATSVIPQPSPSPSPGLKLFVGNWNGSTITEYASPYTGAPIATNSNGLQGPISLAFDPSGDLFVANSNTTITEYAAPYTGAPVATILISEGMAFQRERRPLRNEFFEQYRHGVRAALYRRANCASISNSVNDPIAVAFDARAPTSSLRTRQAAASRNTHRPIPARPQPPSQTA